MERSIVRHLLTRHSNAAMNWKEMLHPLPVVTAPLQAILVLRQGGAVVATALYQASLM